MKISDIKSRYMTAPEKENEDTGTSGAIIDPFIAGTGRMAEDLAGTFFRKTRGDRDPEEYRNDSDFSSIRALEDWGREVRESHHHEYEPQTWQWYLQQAAESVPEMLATMGVSTAAGSAVAPVVGTAGGAALGALRSAPIIGRGVTALGKAIQAYLRGNSTGSKVARAFTPRDARIFSSAEIGAGIEAELEAQGVYQQAIDAGMSVEDAERAAADARLKNFGIISLANVPSYNYILGSPARRVLGMARPTQQGLPSKVGKFAGHNVLPESLEEGAQEIANQSALPFGYDPQAWLDSAIVGGLMGTGTGGVGVVANRVVNGAPPSYEEQMNIWEEANRIHSQNEADKYARKKYETLHGDEIRRQSQYDATKEQMRGSGIDNFMRAISGQESGSEEGDYDLTNPDSGAAGRFQIMPSNWSAWAQDAGLPADAPMTPENQERVARNKMLEYYREYGNWRDVASKWYSGRAVSELSKEDYNAPNYSNGNEYPSISEYVESVMTRFRDISGRNSDAGNENAAYLGENGKGEGKYWTRQSDNVSLEGAHPDLSNAVDMLAKWYYDHTGKRLVVTAGTNGEHADGEHSHSAGWKVDVNDFGFGEDGALTTPEGEKGYLTDEFITYGRSLGLGMNWEGGANNAHIDVALDGTQWDGNGGNVGGFNPNVSTQSHADQLYNQRITKGVQREQEEIRKPKEPEKPLFEINAEDPTTQKLIEQFLTDTTKTALTTNDTNTLKFMEPLFDDKSAFVATPENIQAVTDRYGDELRAFLKNNLQLQGETSQETATTPKTPSQNKASQKQGDYLQQLRVEGRKFLEELKQTQDPTKTDTAFRLQSLLKSNKASDVAELEKLLKENGRTIQQSTQQQKQPQQQQEEPVSKNKPPKNVLPRPKLKQKYREDVLATAINFIDDVSRAGAQATPTQMETIGKILAFTDAWSSDYTKASDKDIIEIAKILRQGGVEVAEPQIDTESYNKELLEAAQQALPLKTRIQQALDKAEQQRKIKAVSKTTNLQAEDAAFSAQEQYWRKQKKQSQEAEANALSALASNNPTYTGFQEEEVEKARLEEEEKQRQAKQAKELKELQERQAEEKRLSQQRAQDTERQNKTITQRQLLKSDLERALNRRPATDKNVRKQQGNQIANLINSSPFIGVFGKIQLPRGMETMLRDGQAKAITQAQLFLRQKGVKPIDWSVETEPAQIESTTTAREAPRPTAEPSITHEAPRNARLESDLEIALRKISNNPRERKAQAETVLRLLNLPQLNQRKLPAGLEQSLKRGEAGGIRAAQQILLRNQSPLIQQSLENAQQKDTQREADQKQREENNRIEGLKTLSELQETAEMKNSIRKEYERQEKAAAEEHNRQEREESEETAERTSPEELRRNFQQAQYLGDADTNERLNNLQTKGRKERDEEKTRQKAAEQTSRINTAKDILRLLRDPKYSEAKTKIETTPGLMTGLLQGSKEALRAARSIITETDKQNQPEQSKRFDFSALAKTEPEKQQTKSETKQSTQPEEIQPVKEEAAQPKKNRNKAVYGHTAEGRSDNKTPYKVRYKVVEANDLTVSHEIENGNVFTNKKYPAELQPRQRERVSMQANLISMAGNLDPEYLMDSKNINQGAPVVRNDGVVLNGNGRVAAVRYAYEQGTTHGYKEALISNAEKLGLNADDISKMERPVLIRELVEELTPKQITDLTTSQEGGVRYGATEQALVDATRISEATLARFPKGTNIDLKSEDAAPFVRAVLKDIASQNELPTLLNRRGQISLDGINRVTRALFAKAYGGSAAVDRMAESTDDNVKNITNSLLQVTPFMAKIKGLMESGKLPKYNFGFFADALEKASDLRGQGISLYDFLNQSTLFEEGQTEGDKLPQEVQELLQTFNVFKRSQKKLTNAVKEIGQQIYDQRGLQEATLDGIENHKPKSFAEIIKKARESVQLASEGTALFSKVGETDTRIDNFVDDKDLTPQQKLLKSFGEKLGVETVFFRNEDGDFHGAHDDNITYINVNSKMPLGKVFWHESLHWLKANNPELYKALVKAAGITDAQRQAYLEETERNDLPTDEAINEEILADQFEDAAKRTGLFQSIAGKNRGLIQRVIQWLKDTMNKFIDHFRNPDGKLTTKQAQAFADEFGRIANQLKDPNGNKIFRYNHRTRNIELADGRNITETSFTENELRERIAKGEREGTIKYSASNNNSIESLKQTIRSIAPSWFSAPQQRRKKQITDTLRRLSGHRILYGYVDGADAVVVDHLQKLIQARQTYDWENLLPVVGKEIAKQLKLSPTQEQSNCIANWFLTGTLNNRTAEAKAFEKAMRDNPAMAELFQSARDIFEEIANMTPQERIGSTLISRPQKSYWEKIKALKKDFTEQFLDDLHPLQKLVDKAVKEASPAVAAMIKQGVNVKQLAQLARGRGAIANIMVNGKVDGKTADMDTLRATLAERYAGISFKYFKPLTAIFESVGGDWKGLQTFAVAKLSKEIYEYNRAHPNEEHITPYTSEEDADAVIRDGEAKFGKAQQDLVNFSKTLLQIRYESGLLTDDQFFALWKKWKNYVPMARVFDENEEYFKFNDLKRREGHKNDTWSPIETMIMNTHKVIQACERNKVKLEIATLVRFGNFDSNLSEVPTSNPDADNIIRFKENGKTKYLETPDPAIKRAVDAVEDRADGSWITKTLRATAGFLRAAYTMLNPDFAAGNVFRDLPDAMIHNKQLGDTKGITGMVHAWSTMFKMLPSAFSEAREAFWNGKFSKDFLEWQINGGAQASFVSEDVDYVQRSINSATTGKRFSGVLDAFQKFSEFSENVTRLTSYKAAKANLAKAGVTGTTGKELAALAAREASIDFSKAGRSMRTINKGVVFANAAVQGINQWVEAFREAAKGNTKPLFSKVFRAAVQGVLLASLQFAAKAFGDDDDKKAYEQAPDWEKETYWIFPSLGLRIPKGMDVGLRLFANLTDEALGYTVDKRSINFGRFFEMAKNALPSLTATAVTPIIEVALNKSYFRGAPIDPKSEQHLPAHMRYDTSTSGIAKWFGEVTGWSPRKIDYLINGYLGFMGRFATHLPDYAMRMAKGEPPMGWDEAPMARRFLFTPYKNPKVVKDFYETYEEQEQLYNGYQLDKSAGLPNKYNSRLHKRIKATYEKMHNISKQVRLTMLDTKLSHSERKARLQELEKRRIAIAERALNEAQ